MRTRSRKKLPFEQRLSPEERRFKRFAADMQSRRSCGGCTACCDAVAVEEIDKPEFTPCKHICGTGCGIYVNRPAQCRGYMCAWKAQWAPIDESWRPDHLGVIFDLHEQGMGGQPAFRCWQLRSQTQVLDDPQVRRMAYGLAAGSNLPIVARYGNIWNISVHLISRLAGVRAYLAGIAIPAPAFLLTPDVIVDPQDFDREREPLPDDELAEILGQFGLKAFEQHTGLKRKH